jgi:hypothetical protein
MDVSSEEEGIFKEKHSMKNMTVHHAAGHHVPPRLK